MHPSPLSARAKGALATLVTALLVVAGALVAPAATADAGPAVTVTPSHDLDPAAAHTLTVHGTGFTGDGAASGVYVGIGETTVWSGGAPLPHTGWLAFTWVPATSLVSGAFTTTLDVPAGALDPARSYHVVTSAAHALSATDRSLDTLTPVTVAQPAPEPTPTPTPTASATPTPTPTPTPEPSPPAPVFTPALELYAADGTTPLGDRIVRAGDTIVVKGSGFDPAANVGGRGVPIPRTLPQGTYVVFGNFGADWRPSEGAPASQRKVAAQRWALASSVLEQVPAQYQSAVRAQWAPLSEDGTFEIALVLEGTETVDGGTWGVYTYGAGGVSNAAQELRAPIAYSTSTLDVEVASADAAAGAAVQVEASGLTGTTAAYAALIEKGTEASVTSRSGYVAFAYLASIADGAFSTTMRAETAKLDRTKAYEVIVWKLHTLPGADTILARGDVPFTAAHWNDLFPGTSPAPGPAPTPVPEPAPETAAPGALSWAISSSFASYITSSIAHGAITVGGGATLANGRYQFGQAAGSTFDRATGTGSVAYTGSVRFTGHGGVLDVTIANPHVRITGPDSAALYVRSGSADVHFADLALSRAARVDTGRTVTFVDAPATLTAAGRTQVLSGFDTTLDPLTITIGAPSAAPAGVTGTVAAAPAPASRDIPATPPATTGIDLDPETLAALASGATATVSAAGFRPNETGIAVVVYSSPVLLATVDADARGVATWTGSLPAGLEDGEHTLTFQGSVSRGIRFTLARAASVQDACVVEGATLRWGFKETFRNYLEGIAGGAWEVDGIVYDYPEFVWDGGAGSVDAAAGTGLVAFPGTLRFTGHGGVLDTTLSGARVELAGDTGYLVFDVSGTTQSGAPVALEGVRFAEFAVPAGAITAAGIELAGVPATLTSAGADAFGTYPAGEEMDPVYAVLPLSGACGDVAATDAAAPTEAAAAASPEAALSAQDAPVWPWIAGGAGALVLLAVIAGVVIARRKAAAAE